MSKTLQDVCSLVDKIKTLGIKIETRISSTGIDVWFGEQDPRDAGYTNAMCKSLDEVHYYLINKLLELEGETRAQSVRAIKHADNILAIIGKS